MRAHMEVVRKQNEALVRAVGQHQPAQTVLDVEATSIERADAHVGSHTVWDRSRSGWDCSHYCLPGLPDLWSTMLGSVLCGGRR